MAATLVAVGRRRRFGDGAIIQQRGDASDGFWLIETGQVMVCRYGRDGELIVYAVLGPGDLFGELACFSGVPRQVDAVADGDAVLVRVDAAQVDRLLATRPDFARWLLQSLAHQLRGALDRIEGDHSHSAVERLTRVLAAIAARDGPEIAATQQQLADLVGVSRVTAGQGLGALAAAGLIEKRYGRIRVIDVEALAARGARPS